jgi:S-phase kinase-associated protein 1
MSRQIILVSQSDGTKIETDTDSANNSGLLRSLIEEYTDNLIEIPEIKGSTLQLIVEFLEHMKDNPCSELPKPLPQYDLRELISEWENNFLAKFDNDIYKLFEFINGVNYLDVRPLLELCCAKAATIVKDYEQQKFMEVFQIEADMTEEDLKKLEIEFEKEREIEREKKKLDEVEKENPNNGEKLYNEEL